MQRMCGFPKGAAYLAVLAAAFVASPCFAQSAGAPPTHCAPAEGVNFVCGVENPEDIVPVPGTHWLITSGMKPGGGLKLVDADSKTARPLYTGAQNELRPDKQMYPHCPAAPDPKTFNTHGIYLRQTGPAQYNLYAVSHSPYEAVQVFRVEMQGNAPALSWSGCVPGLPGYVGNGVAAYSDGTILVTVSDRPGTTKAQELAGILIGNVLTWSPGDAGFSVLRGAILAGDNGLEISPDEKEFYVGGFGSGVIGVYSRSNPAQPLRTTKAPGFMPDNLRWSGNRLLAAGPMFDEPACGGTRLGVVTSPTRTACHRGYMVAELDPTSMTWTVVDYSGPNPEMNGVASGVIVGKTLWIGSNTSEGVAYRTLPEPPQE